MGQKSGEFTAAQLSETLEKLFKGEGKRLEKFAAQHCVANAEATGSKHYNYLFRVGAGRFRMWKQGDPIEYTHASSPTMPEVSRVPPEHKSLYTTGSRFPAELRPVEVAAKPAETKAEKTKHEAGKKPTPVITETGTRQYPTRGLLMAEGLDENVPANLARRTIFDMLFLEMGKIGSRLESQQSENFVINLEPHTGMVATRKNVMLKLPNGTAVSHMTDILIEAENPSRSLYIDIVESYAPPEDVKSHAFDAMHLRKDGKQRYGILVFLRGSHGMLQEQAEAVAYPYDFFFGQDSAHVKDPNKFYALKAQVLAWLGGKVKQDRAGAT
ncbi:MAG: hypothetical protein HYT80_01365 [Euryarchaeota archaeon]|nr:hypothetical protein [Euryarchaeota archaeon]